jgi:hypothetical protein
LSLKHKINDTDSASINVWVKNELGIKLVSSFNTFPRMTETANTAKANKSPQMRRFVIESLFMMISYKEFSAKVQKFYMITKIL